MGKHNNLFWKPFWQFFFVFVLYCTTSDCVLPRGVGPRWQHHFVVVVSVCCSNVQSLFLDGQKI
jgi:hypothetical protein